MGKTIKDKLKEQVRINLDITTPHPKKKVKLSHMLDNTKIIDIDLRPIELDTSDWKPTWKRFKKRVKKKFKRT